MGTELNFKYSTHNGTIYKTVFNGHKVLLLRQVDDIMIQTVDTNIARENFTFTGLKLQLKNEGEPLFAYLGSTDYFNGVDIKQSKTHIIISCENYVDRLLRAHSWNKIPNKPFNYATKAPSPLPNNTLDKIFTECGPDEGTPAAYKLELEAKFGY